MMLSNARLSLLSVFLLSSLVRSQTRTVLIPFTSLPECAGQCPDINAAHDACVAQNPTDDNAAATCYCTYPALATTYQNSAGTCSAVCTAENDREAIRTAYIAFCPQQAAAAGLAPAATTSILQAPTGAASSNLPASQFNGSSQTDNWLSNHYQWVIMIVILVIAGIVGIIVGLWLKKRHRRKKEIAGANLASTENTAGTRPVSEVFSAPPGSSHSNAAGRNSVTSVTLPQRNMSQTSVGGMMGMNSGVAPPRSRGLHSSRSRSSTINSYSGPITMGPHSTSQTAIPAVPPISPVYASGDYPERTYSPATSNRNSTALYPPISRPDSTGPPSPIGQAVSPGLGSDEKGGFGGGYTGAGFSDGAGAQRIREMRSRENVVVSRTGTPDSISGGRRLSKKISKKSAGGREG